MTYWHRHVSEREPSSQPDDPLDPPGWEDCVPCSGVMFARALTEGSTAIPATLPEAEALRRDAGVGPGGGLTSDDLRRGLAKRYGFTGEQVAGAPTLADGDCAVLSGKLSNFPAGHRLRRWDADYAGGHAVFVYRVGTVITWADPLAPNTVGGKPWGGEPVTAAEVRTFCGTGRTNTVGRIGGQAVAITAVKGEDWKALPSSAFPAGNGVLRAAPSLTAPILVRLATGTIVRTIGELTNADGQWRLTEWSSKPAWLLYRTALGTSPDWAPLVPGGDPAVDAELSAYIYRSPDPTPFGPADIEAATLAGRRIEWERQKSYAIVTLAGKP